MKQIIKNIYKKIFWRYDKHILIYPTFKCNFRCPYCLIYGNKFFPNINDAGMGKEWAEKINQFGRAFVCISGGEPFYWKEFKDFIINLRKDDWLAITTNLSWEITDEWIEILKSHKRLSLACSFHKYGIREEDFIENFKKLRKHFKLIQASMVGYPELIPIINDLMKKFKDNGIKLNIQSYVHPNYKYNEEEREKLSKLFENPCREDEFEFEHQIKAKQCTAGQDYWMIVPNGDIYLCNAGFFYVNSQFHKKWEANKWEFVVGNIFKNNRVLTVRNLCEYPCSEACDRNWAKVKAS